MEEWLTSGMVDWWGSDNTLLISPATIALISGSLLNAGIVVGASVIGIRIIDAWDLDSGTERQLSFERKTYLISTILNISLAYELFSLLLFITMADHIHSLFTGAMCAAGTLNVNDYGYITLLLKIVNAITCGLWLIVNHVDNQAPDYPLIKMKYKFLAVLAVLMVQEAYLQWRYITGLDPQVITSCCGTLFSENAVSLAGQMAHIPSLVAKVLYYGTLLVTIRVGIHYYLTGRAASLFSTLNAILFALSLIAVISFISVYYYELPTHHCPFCLLQSEYHFIGYFLYFSLFAAGIPGIGVALIDRFKEIASLILIVPRVAKRLCLASLLGHLIFAAISIYPMIFSDFKLEGY